jgi:hypothetical protein
MGHSVMNRPIFLACLAFASPVWAQTAAESFETAATLRATDLLPAHLLLGPSHRVRELVPTDGYLAHFTIDSDFGTFTATGVPEARRRFVEIQAIRTLAETSKSDLFAEGLRRSVEQPIDAVKNIVGNPVGSLKQAPKTVGHFFGKVGSAIGRGAHKTADRLRDPENEVSAADTGRQLGQVAKNAAGFDKAKLDTARQLGVDPYSDNTRLQEEMDKVTWAFFAGGLPLRIGASVASAGIAVAATEMVGIPENTYDLTASELALRDERSLAAMGVSSEDIRAFQIHPALSTTRRHRITSYLEALPGASGRGHMVRLANSCTTAGQADFLIESLAILAARERAGAAHYRSLRILGRLPGATTAGGELQVPAPVDYVSWTPEVARFARRDDLGSAPKHLVHTGKLTPTTQAGFLAAGWQTTAVDLPGR